MSVAAPVHILQRADGTREALRARLPLRFKNGRLQEAISVNVEHESGAIEHRFEWVDIPVVE